jgi:hypothetical protein
VSRLLVTRIKRDLQSVDFGRISDTKAAVCAAELVSTDPHKQWTFKAHLAEAVGSAFFDVAMNCFSGRSSLTDLDVVVSATDLSGPIDLLSAVPTLTSFVVHLTDKV